MSDKTKAKRNSPILDSLFFILLSSLPDFIPLFLLLPPSSSNPRLTLPSQFSSPPPSDIVLHLLSFCHMFLSFTSSSFLPSTLASVPLHPTSLTNESSAYHTCVSEPPAAEQPLWFTVWYQAAIMGGKVDNMGHKSSSQKATLLLAARVRSNGCTARLYTLRSPRCQNWMNIHQFVFCLCVCVC